MITLNFLLRPRERAALLLLALATTAGLTAFTASSTAHAAAPASSVIVYNLSRNGLPLGTITEHFEASNGEYHATSEARASGLAALVLRDPARYVSTGALTKDGLRPQRFEGHLRGKSLSADFDWAAKKLTLIHDGVNRALDLPAGTQDRLSIMYQLMYFVRGANGKTQTLDVAMTNGRKLERYRYAVHPDVTIDTPFKRLNTVHLIKQREAPNDSGTEVWVAPELNHLPVKVVIIEDDGVRYEQVATHVEVKP